MRFTPEFLDELRSRLPVSEVVRRRVQLKKSGREWRGLSPFNKEKTPSFFVNDQKLIKQRQESVELYDKGGRPELAAQERSEIEMIASFLPQQLSEAEAKEAIAGVIRETGAAGMKDMGKVIAALKERYAGRMDFGKSSAVVKGLLTG